MGVYVSLNIKNRTGHLLLYSFVSWIIMIDCEEPFIFYYVMLCLSPNSFVP